MMSRSFPENLKTVNDRPLVDRDDGYSIGQSAPDKIQGGLPVVWVRR
jgi:hypothetical protein